MGHKSDEPKLGIGLPVYNGENYVAAAIESILDQTFGDFELIICDNASTDRTAEICERYAARDDRARVLRNPHNLGAAANYNRVFAASRGEYFKWHAHDDLLAPRFLERCVSALDADAGAVLCRTLVTLIDSAGEEVGHYDPGLRGTGSERASDRFAEIVLPPHMGTDFFGVFRRRALEETPLHGTYHGSDQVLLAVLALRGRFLQVREPLFMNRSHSERYSDGVQIQDRGAWHDTSGRSRVRFPLWRQYAEYVREVRRQLGDRRERLRCYGHLVRWWFTNWNALRMIVDVAVAFDPRVFGLVRRVKRRILGLNDLGFDWDRWRRKS